MTFYVENESGHDLDFDFEILASKVMNQALDYVECPYEVQVNVIITDNQEIQRVNELSRGINKPTDVLSFPNIDYTTPAVFDHVEEFQSDYFDPDSGELILGDIMISIDKMIAQAEEFGHSLEREYAFLIAHSMFHLFGFDHQVEVEAKEMERMQEEVLQKINITRD
jgi:probable rRNA maturation factor